MSWRTRFYAVLIDTKTFSKYSGHAHVPWRLWNPMPLSLYTSSDKNRVFLDTVYWHRKTPNWWVKNKPRKSTTESEENWTPKDILKMIHGGHYDLIKPVQCHLSFAWPSKTGALERTSCDTLTALDWLGRLLRSIVRQRSCVRDSWTGLPGTVLAKAAWKKARMPSLGR